MTATEKKRPWFQYHLSTLIVLQFVAAGLLWLNIHERNSFTRDLLDPFMIVFRGWPWTCHYRFIAYDQFGNSLAQAVFSDTNARQALDYRWLAANVAVALAILFAVAIILEWRIRRTERKPR